MTTKDDGSARETARTSVLHAGAAVIAEGCGEKGRDFDPTRPERNEEEPAGKGPAGRPVTHGTPLAPDEYARLKERAKRGGPEDRGGPAQHDR